jgi:hypothetical protein
MTSHGKDRNIDLRIGIGILKNTLTLVFLPTSGKKHEPNADTKA